MISIPWAANLRASEAVVGGVEVHLLIIAPIDLDSDGLWGKASIRAGVVPNVFSLRFSLAILVFEHSDNVAGSSRG